MCLQVCFPAKKNCVFTILSILMSVAEFRVAACSIDCWKIHLICHNIHCLFHKYQCTLHASADFLELCVFISCTLEGCLSQGKVNK